LTTACYNLPQNHWITTIECKCPSLCTMHNDTGNRVWIVQRQ